MIDSYYKGHAELFAFPYSKGVNPQLFTPLDQLSTEAREIFSYDPEKARQLLKEAGYPNGFKTSILTTSANVDFLAIIKEYFLKIGVDMTLDVRENNTVSTMNRGRTYAEMTFGNTQENWAVWKMHGLFPERATNLSFFSGDARAKAAYEDMNRYLGRDDARVGQILKGFAPYFIENLVYGAVLPLPYIYDVYQPWLKNFNGEEHVGYWDPNEAWRFRWVDQDLKKSLGY
jgi:peptide/nickel transport system substrate-binding protein